MMEQEPGWQDPGKTMKQEHHWKDPGCVKRKTITEAKEPQEPTERAPNDPIWNNLINKIVLDYNAK